MANFNGLKQLFWAALYAIFLAIAYPFKQIAKGLVWLAEEFNRRAGR